MTFNLFSSQKDSESPSTIDNVNINRDGVVSLNLKSKSVQTQLLAQIAKLKTYEEELKAS